MDSVILDCTVLGCIVMASIVLDCTVLGCSVMVSIVLDCTVLGCIVMDSILLYWTALYWLYCNEQYHIALDRSVMDSTVFIGLYCVVLDCIVL